MRQFKSSVRKVIQINFKEQYLITSLTLLVNYVLRNDDCLELISCQFIFSSSYLLILILAMTIYAILYFKTYMMYLKGKLWLQIPLKIWIEILAIQLFCVQSLITIHIQTCIKREYCVHFQGWTSAVVFSCAQLSNLF